MSSYFILLDGVLFEERMRPALAASWRLRSFDPCRSFCESLLPNVEEFDSRYHTGEGETLVKEVLRGLPFEREFWRSLTGELLFYAAADIPEVPTCPDTLCCLLAPDRCGKEDDTRPILPPILQAHRGSRDLAFGSTIYRREHCGFNGREDVQRLAEYLASLDTSRWRAADLALLDGLAEDEREEELDIAREWFPALRGMFRQARDAGQVIVHEIL